MRRYLTFRSLPSHVAFVDNEIFKGVNETDISDHLSVIFALAMSKKPRTILELGTRGGESTKVLTLVTNQIGAKGYSVDLSEAPEWLNEQKNWHHFVADDTEFCKNLVHSWPNGDSFTGIDFLFLDTSHFYEHTLQELNLYWDLINEDGILVLHDTNCTSVMSRRLSGSSNTGWDNQRGVIRAVEEFFECSIDENSLISKNLLSRGAKGLTHFPWNNGLTVIYR
jgi:predicted O-methyltransferase YrrM